MGEPPLVLCVAGSSGGHFEELGSDGDQFEPVIERRGRDALRTLDRECGSVGCIVSRFELPEMDGLEFLESVRDTYPDLPFILFTAQGSEELASAAISAGVTDYVQADVPDSRAVLAERLESAIEDANPDQHRRPLEELADSTTDCLWIFTRDWDELLYISGYEEVWDRPAEQIATNPQDFIEGVHPEDRDHVRAAMERLSAGESLDTEYRIVRGDGEIGWVWVKGEPVFDDAGNVVRVAGFTRDVTERKQRERQFETLVENLPGVVYRAEIDHDWPMKSIHGECEELTGYTADEIRNQLNFGRDLIHPDDRGDVYETIYESVDADESFEMTYRIVTSGGDTRWVWERGREVDDGVIEGFMTDITARVTHEQELELRNQAIREAPVGIIITEAGGDDNPIIYANDKFLEMSGYPEAEVLGRDCRFLQGPETKEEPVRAMREAIANAEPVTVELRNYRKDGSMFWNRVSIAPVRDEDGTVSNFIGFQVNVTERKQRQEQLKVLSRVLRHNLRNNQNAIRSWAEALGSRVDPELATFADRIVGASDRLIAIAEKERVITEILTEKPRHHSVDLDSLLGRIVSEFECEFPEAEFSLDCPEGTTVRATARIETAIEELLTNAVVHNDAVTPTVSVDVSHSGDTVDIRIEDNGPPIPEMEYPGLMQDKQDSPVYHHGGLGLWLVNLVVSRSNGSLSFEENDPRGNVVRLTVPS